MKGNRKGARARGGNDHPSESGVSITFRGVNVGFLNVTPNAVYSDQNLLASPCRLTLSPHLYAFPTVTFVFASASFCDWHLTVNLFNLVIFSLLKQDHLWPV